MNDPFRTEIRGDVWASAVNRLDGLKDAWFDCQKSDQIFEILYQQLDPIIDLVVRKLTPAEQLAFPPEVERRFGFDAKRYTHARLKEWKGRAPTIEAGNGSCAELLKIHAASWAIDNYPDMPEQILPDLFDVGDKLCLVAPPKAKKSFFVLQMALHLATGQNFLELGKPTKSRRVLLVQNEISFPHFHRRVRDMSVYLGIRSQDIDDRCCFVNTRGTGAGISDIARLALNHGSEVIIFDPLYKLLSGDENAASDMKPTLAEFDRITEELGTAIVYVHHDKKGVPGANLLSDRGAGSGVLSRDYDAAMFLSDHATEENTFVLDFLIRNYAPRDALSLCWNEQYRFFELSEVEPVTATKAGKKPMQSMANMLQAGYDILNDGPKGATDFWQTIRTKLQCSNDKAREIASAIRESKDVEIYKEGFKKMIKLKDEYKKHEDDFDFPI